MANQTQDFTLVQLSSELGALLQQRDWRVATAESCTGGGIATAITAVPGSSGWFEYGLVTYANRAKCALLGVDPELIKAQGAVSEAVVLDMVTGALELSGADIAVSVSGIAGPEGGGPDKPVGTVWFGWGLATGWRDAKCYYFTGDRAKIRRQSVVVALRELLSICRHRG